MTERSRRIGGKVAAAGEAASASARRRRLVIRASAGSGKTYQLSTRFIAHLESGRPDRILATTFTRKAAGEILERVLLRLAEAADDDQRRDELRRSLEVAALPRARCVEMLCGLVRQLHRVRVATLDSFFSRIAGSFALELGLPPGWRILDEVEDGQLRARAIEEVLQLGDRRDIVQLVHLLAKGDARRSVTALVRDTVDELYAIFQETSESAWRPLEGPSLLGREALDDALARLRAARLPQDKKWAAAREADLAAFEQADWEAFIRKGLAGKVLCGESTYCGKEIEPHVASLYRRLLDHVAAIECQQLSHQLAAARDLLTRFDAAYGRLKREAAGLTFDDVARRLAEELAGQDPRGLAFRLDAQVRHLLLDEFQDTSLTQWRVLEPLARVAAAGRDGTSFFCVGDVKQAIYGWRGGVAEIFDTVTARLEGLAEECLDQSYRSARPVIDTVNAVFAPRDALPLLDEQQSTFVEWVKAFPRHTTHLTRHQGYACLRTVPIPESGQSQKPAVLSGAAEFLHDLFPRLGEQVTVGVLVRTNDAVGRMIHELRRRGLSASEEGGNPLVDSAAVQLVLSALRLADHPGDTIARFHVAHSPLGPHVELAPEHDDTDAEAAAEHIRRQLVERGYGAVVYDWAAALRPCCSIRELDRLRQLVALADDYEALATLRTSDFVRFVEASHVEDPRTARIRVMTVHKAKGLEFDAVVLPQLDEPLVRPPKFVALRRSPVEAAVRVCRYRNQAVQRLLPADVQEAFRQTADRALRDALCVFYVALTRAARALYMFIAPRPKQSKTCAGILRATLAPGKPCDPHAVLYECGREDWYASVTPASQTAPVAASSTLEPPDAASRERAVQAAGPTPSAGAPGSAGAAGAAGFRPIRLASGERRRGREQRAPSHFKPHRLLSINEVLRTAGSRALERGQLLHKWFETMRWIERSLPGDAELSRIASGAGFSERLVAECAREFRSMLSEGPLRELLCRDTYRESARRLFGPGVCDGDDVEISVETERRFDILQDGAVLSGSIDRLVLFSCGGQYVAADVLDYKSDAVRGDDDAAASRLVEFYQAQLEAYARAVAHLYELPRSRVATRLVLLETRRVINVPSLPSGKRTEVDAPRTLSSAAAR